MNGFQVGDYVIADRAEYDTFEGTTWVVKGFSRSLLGLPLVKVGRIDRPLGSPTVFYPHELSFEDGTRPAPESGS